ncbi:pre-mRNA-splicing factor prp46 [Friedmanniomyces endolithicus]|nr:pre-mRNA-splicing factor prp46 [Friedmanniomyces endolithicus]
MAEIAPATTTGPAPSDIPPEITARAAEAVRRSAKRTREVFAAEFGRPSALQKPPQPDVAPSDPSPYDRAQRASVAARIRREHADVRDAEEEAEDGRAASDPQMAKMIEDASAPRPGQQVQANGTSTALTRIQGTAGAKLPPNANGPTPQRNTPSTSLVRRDTVRQQKPQWRPPWKLFRVISGHLGWVRALAMEPGNQWFASGAGDRTIKIWDLASGTLKLTLTEDEMVKCWDLETNKVVRHYHGHLSGVYTLSLHPTLDVLCTGGRDGVVRVWDMRTRSKSTSSQATKPQSPPSSPRPRTRKSSPPLLTVRIRMYDLAAGKPMGVLTHHKKGVRSLATHPTEYTFASASASPGQIKQWLCPEGQFMQNLEGHNSVINSLSVNEDNVLFSGGDNRSIAFWDGKTGHRYQYEDSVAQPGSLDAEAGIMSSMFDLTGLRLDENATEESHPLEWRPTLGRQKF